VTHHIYGHTILSAMLVCHRKSPATLSLTLNETFNVITSHLISPVSLFFLPLRLTTDLSLPSFFLSFAPCFSFCSLTRELATLPFRFCLCLNPRGESEPLPHLSPPSVPYHLTATVVIILWPTTHQSKTCWLPSLKGCFKPPLSPDCLCSHALRNFILKQKKLIRTVNPRSELRGEEGGRSWS
jgi:hypothetical protein